MPRRRTPCNRFGSPCNQKYPSADRHETTEENYGAADRTLFLSRLIGLYGLLVGLPMMSHQQLAVEGVTAPLQNPCLMLLLFSITLAGPLGMVLDHNLCSSPLTLITFSSGSFIISSSSTTTQLFQTALCIFLTYAGFNSHPH